MDAMWPCGGAVTELQRGLPVGVTGAPSGRFEQVSALLGRIGFGRSASELARTRREIVLAAVVWVSAITVTMRAHGVWIAIVLFVWVIPFLVLAIVCAVWVTLDGNGTTARRRRREIVAVLDTRRRRSRT
jgi:fatty acid desaturase